tara:strand:+ start:140 stop:778 length:639 start_codon:yes stop_codon:yes gene_type:complete
MAISYNILDLGKADYTETWEIQKELQAKRISGQIDDQLLLVEHPPVYTLGKNAPIEDLLIKDNDDISIIQTDRGGKITFHGPGQLVGYPIIDLNNYKRSISWYMRELEQLIINVLLDYNINSQRKKGLTGIWVKDKKIAALGVRISRWVTMHGFSLNINPDLSYYEGIVPCGITDFGVTSMAEILEKKCPKISDIKLTIIDYFSSQFSGGKN